VNVLVGTVPLWIVILLVVSVPIALIVFIIKGIKFTKETIIWLISGLIAYTITGLLIGFGLQEWFASLGNLTRYIAFSGLNLVSTIPATVLLRYILTPLFKILKWQGHIG